MKGERSMIQIEERDIDVLIHELVNIVQTLKILTEDCKSRKNDFCESRIKNITNCEARLMELRQHFLSSIVDRES